MTHDELAKQWDAAEPGERFIWLLDMMGWHINADSCAIYDVQDRTVTTHVDWQPLRFLDSAALVVAEIGRLGCKWLWFEQMRAMILAEWKSSWPEDVAATIQANYDAGHSQTIGSIDMSVATASADARCCAAWMVWMMHKESGDETD